MSKDINGLTNESNRQKVDEIRAKFLSDVDINADMYDPIDVQRVRTEDWQIERFVLTVESVDKAYEALIKAMRWKKSFDLHSRSLTYFPKEFIDVFGCKQISRDREGRAVLWAIGRHYIKIAHLSDLVKYFMAYLCELLDRESGNCGFIFAVNVMGAGIKNTDLSIVLFAIELLNYYPNCVHKILGVDLPWILSGITKVSLAFVPKSYKNKINIIKNEELVNYFDAEIIPVSFGGKCETCFENMDQMTPLRDCTHLGLSVDQINNFYNVYKNLLNKI